MVNITMDEFHQLAKYIKENSGINLKDEKQALLAGRLQNVLVSLHMDNFTDYYHYLQSDTTGQALSVLLDRITTNHTFFMREPDHFYYFKDKVLPYLASSVKDHDLRIWCAACSTGEESYTLAMIMDEFFKENKRLWNTKILATDISTKVLDEAQKGIYAGERIAPLSSYWKMQYFQKFDAENMQITDEIRNEVIYRRFNVMDAFPFKKKFHVIFCRNLMIYFDNATKENLVDKFYHMTEPGGYLFIGHSESLNRQTSKYHYVMPAIYRKE